jgi:hypothetical protein
LVFVRPLPAPFHRDPFAELGARPAFARTAALVLHFDVIWILLPVCRNFVSLLRRTPLNDIIPFDKNITFHKATAWSIVFWTVIHIIAHTVNFVHLAMASTKSPKGIFFDVLLMNFTTGPGVTGWIMVLCLLLSSGLRLRRGVGSTLSAFGIHTTCSSSSSSTGNSMACFV